jgi:hypothetical protein
MTASPRVHMQRRATPRRAIPVAVSLAGILAAAGGSSCGDTFRQAPDSGADAKPDAGADVEVPVPNQGCVPGSTASCYCAGAERGRQTCGSDGVPGPCEGCPEVGSGDAGAIPCGAGTCNPATQFCVQDPASKLENCLTKCATNTDCGPEGCCALLQSEGKFTGQAACTGPRINGGYCRCATQRDCGPGGACTPDPLRGTHYTCQPDDGSPYHGCHAARCVGYHDCVGDCRGNRYCAPADATLTNCPQGSGFCISGYIGPPATPPCYNPSTYDCNRACMLCSCMP